MYGPFEVIERLGIGGMATVHRAVERGIEGFERVIALKRLLPHLAEDEAFVRAFVREAKLASLLQHGNIVQLYELGRVGASYFISMEYIQGRDVRRILRQAKRMTGPLPVPIAVAIVGELLDALDYAHTRTDEQGTALGLVHRDISPSNLLISQTGHLKVIDFGIAKATLGHLATHTGRIKGKLSYMAPEALTGKSSLDNRSDLFSASIIAHELLTAHPLFAARNDFHTIERVQSMEAPPPSERNPEVPPSLDALVLRGLAKDPAHRWRSAGEMRAALAEITLRHRLTCTNREVADWVEIAFALGNSHELAPGSRALAPASQLPLPLSPSGPSGTQPYGLVPRPETNDADSDEVLDMVWDSGGSGEAAPVIVDGVPDVSARFTLVDPVQELVNPVEDLVHPADELVDSIDELVHPADELVDSIDELVESTVDEDDPTSTRDSSEPVTSRPRAPTARPAMAARAALPPSAALAAGEATGEARITFKPPSIPPPLLTDAFSDDPTPLPPPMTFSTDEFSQVSQLGPPMNRISTEEFNRGSEVAPTATVSMRAGKKKAVHPPRQWAAGTSPQTNRPSRRSLGLQGTGPEAALPDAEIAGHDAAPATTSPRIAIEIGGGIVGRRLGPSRVTWVAAAIAAGALVGIVAWTSTGSDEPRKPAAAAQPPAAKSTRREPLRAMTPPPPEPMVTPVRPPPEPLAAVAAMAAQAEAPARDLVESIPAAADRKAKKRTRDAGSSPAAAAKVPISPIVTPPVASAPPPRAPSMTDGGLQPLPVPVKEPPAVKPRKLATPSPTAVPSIPGAAPTLVAPTRAHRRSGSIPILRGSKNAAPIRAITAKLCVDRKGSVTSVGILSKVESDVRDGLTRALSGWRYDPIVESGTAIPACFATTFRVNQR